MSDADFDTAGLPPEPPGCSSGAAADGASSGLAAAVPAPQPARRESASRQMTPDAHGTCVSFKIPGVTLDAKRFCMMRELDWLLQFLIVMCTFELFCHSLLLCACVPVSKDHALHRAAGLERPQMAMGKLNSILASF